MSGPEPAAAVAGDARKVMYELGDAVTRAVEALRAIPAGDEVAAYSCVRALDTALTGLADLLALVPGIAQLGDPAPAVRERLDRSQSDLVARHADLASYRKSLDALAETEERLGEITAEVSQLRNRIAELERVKQTATEIPGLRATVQALEQDIAALDAPDALEVHTRLATAISQLDTFTERQLATMNEAVTSMVGRTQAAAAKLTELQNRVDSAAAELARLEGEAAQLAEDHADTLPTLAAWTQADLDLAEGMSSTMIATGGGTAANLHAELAGIRQRLTELDDVLGPLLAAHTRAYEEARQIRQRRG